MLPRESVSWQAWADSSAVGKDTRARRKNVLSLWAKANGCDSPQQVLDQIILDKATPYETVNKFLNYLRDEEEDGEEKYSPATMYQYRSMLGGEGDSHYGAGFFLSVLGDENFSTRKFNQLCPSGDNYTQTRKKPPSPAELEHILRDLAGPRDKALLGFLALTGFRISEALTRKFSDLTRKDSYAVVKLQVGDTKKRYKRLAFLTQEILDWINNYHTGLDVPGADVWLFPGYSPRDPNRPRGQQPDERKPQ